MPSTSRLRSIAKQLRMQFLTVAVALTASAFSYGLWYDAKRDLQHDNQAYFDFRVRQLEESINKRLETYEQVLYGARGLFNASDNVTRNEYQNYIASLHLDQRYPGIQGVGFSLLIPKAQKRQHLAQMRHEGFNDYNIRPEGDREFYSSIIYLEPFVGRNLRAFSYDMFSETIRNKAMSYARDNNAISMSGKVKLLQETEKDVQSGFLIYLPVYKTGLPYLTLEERRNHLLGWVYEPFRMKDFMQGIGGEQESDLHLEIFDGDQINEDTRMYGNPLDLTTAPLLTSQREINSAGHRWTLLIHAQPQFKARVDQSKPMIIVGSAGLLSLLLTLLTWQLVNGRSRALALATSMTSEVRKSEAQFRSMFENIPIAYLALDLKKQIIDANQQLCDKLGFSMEQIIGHSIEEFCATPTPALNPDVALAYHTNLSLLRELELTTQDGRIITVLLDSADQYDANQNFVRSHCVLADISERKQMEEEMRKAKEQAERLAQAKSAFVANMSHEIRTPMNAVLGLLQLIQRTSLSDQQRDYAQKAHAAAKSLLGILNDILDFSKVEMGKLELEQVNFHLDQLLRNLSVVLSTAVEKKNIEVLFDIDATIPHSLIGDALRLQQILLNLTGNALKFTEQGEVVVQLHTLETLSDRTTIEFAVQDTGIGIPDDKLSKIFDSFTQAETSTTRRFGGTGLGLAISHRLVSLMGGELTVDSTPGQGSCFKFTLTFQRDRAQESSTITRELNTSQPNLTVLIVDDNAHARNFLKQMAEQLGWHTDLASSGLEALQKVEAQKASNQGRYDVIFIDRNMPGLNGWETALRLRETQQHGTAPIIMMDTGAGREQLPNYVTTDHQPVDGYLVKPITASMLFDIVADISAGHSVSIDRRAPLTPITRHLSGLHILLVEDNAMNQQVARELLIHEGALVDVAGDGRQALAKISATRHPFDIILMDIQMPIMDGFEATNLLRQQFGFKELPIIAMTANALPSDREACLAAGMNDHISKPIDIEVLIKTIVKFIPAIPAIPAIAAQNNMSNQHDTETSTASLQKALARLGHNQQLYANSVTLFCEEQRHVVEQIAAQLDQGATLNATKILHNLKGSAATLGAMTLSNAAANLEALLKQNNAPEPIDGLLDVLSKTLLDDCVALQNFSETLQLSSDDTEFSTTEPIGLDELLLLINSLEALLKVHNLRALNIFQNLKLELQKHTFKLNLVPLETAMNQLDFALALSECQKLRNFI